MTSYPPVTLQGPSSTRNNQWQEFRVMQHPQRTGLHGSFCDAAHPKQYLVSCMPHHLEHLHGPEAVVTEPRGLTKLMPEMALPLTACAPKPMAIPDTPPTASKGWMLMPSICNNHASKR